jgi:hypothetical protein
MQHGGVVGVIADVDVGASLQQQPHAGVPVARRRPVQSRLLLVAAAARVDQVGMSVEQAAELVDVAELHGVENRVQRPLLRWSTGVATLDVAGQELDGIVTLRLGDLVNGAGVLTSGRGIKTLRECAANRLDAAGAGGGKDALADAGIDVGLQRAPARKAVVVRDCKLG